MAEPIYNTLRWQAVRARVLTRDGHTCKLAALLGGHCSPSLDVHHVTPLAEGGPAYDEDNLIVACDRHHRAIEAFRKRWSAEPEPPRCSHAHRTREARMLCERAQSRQAA